ncbi:MAG: MFS transporter [Sciscionella sp.]
MSYPTAPTAPVTTSASDALNSGGGHTSLFSQPKAVWAVAFACVVSFMGIGLVDPILPALSSQLNASPSQVTLLFTSYLLVTAVAMLVTGCVSSRIGAKRTLVLGLVVIVAFSALAGLSSSVTEIIGFRAGWGLGNALFIATSLAVIVGAASGGFGGAIVLYEAALGLGIALGPLAGAVLGDISWRGPFFGVAVLMAGALVLVLTLLGPTPPPTRRVSIAAPVAALRDRGLLTIALTALCYNWGFFTILGYSPFPMKLSIYQLGSVFFGWGVLVALFSVWLAPLAQRRLGVARTLYASLGLLALDLAAIAIWVSMPTVLIIAVILSGALIGINNTVITSTVMSIAPVERPIASAAYSFVRFFGGGVAPFVAGLLAARYNDTVPFALAAAVVLLGVGVLSTAHRRLGALGETESPAQAEQDIEEFLEDYDGDVVHGHLRSPDGSGVADAILTLTDLGGRQVASGRSAADGFFQLLGVDGEQVLLVKPPVGPPQVRTLILDGAAREVPLVLDAS